jgi:hypothetical protein
MRGMNRRNVLLAFAIGIVGALVGGGAVAWANHQFTDVPTSHAFHEQIGSVVDAGCATGFNDGTFRPGDNPTRGQFAYWLNNCGGRAVYGGSQSVFDNIESQRANLAPARIYAGAKGEGTSIVVVMATGYVESEQSGDVQWSLVADDGSGAQEIATVYDAVAGPVAHQVYYGSSVTLLRAVEVPAGEYRDFSLTATRADGLPVAQLHADLVAMTFPFNGDGGAGFPVN